MKLEVQKLGASLLASGPILMNVAPNRAAWWAGFAFVVIGPFLMAIHRADPT